MRFDSRQIVSGKPGAIRTTILGQSSRFDGTATQSEITVELTKNVKISSLNHIA